VNTECPTQIISCTKCRYLCISSSIENL